MACSEQVLIVLQCFQFCSAAKWLDVIESLETLLPRAIASCTRLHALLFTVCLLCSNSSMLKIPWLAKNVSVEGVCDIAISSKMAEKPSARTCLAALELKHTSWHKLAYAAAYMPLDCLV